jgi:DNA-binding NarL/FixJ family response regulator
MSSNPSTAIQYPHLPILVFSFRDEEWYAPQVLNAGADGFLQKRVDRSALVEGTRGTFAGRVVLSRAMSKLAPRRTAC